MITEQKLKEALRILASSEEYAKARAAHEFSNKMEKVVLAQLTSRSNQTSMASKDSWAKTQPEYLQALEQTRDIGELDYASRAKREAANAIIETWRTEQSNERAHIRTA